MILQWVAIVLLTIASGFADSRGFFYASKIWQNNIIQWHELIKSALGFSVGIILFWAALRFAVQVGIVSAEIQTLGWFGVTIVGVALLSGDFLQFSALDKVVAVIVLLGIAWLLVRTQQ